MERIPCQNDAHGFHIENFQVSKTCSKERSDSDVERWEVEASANGPTCSESPPKGGAPTPLEELTVAARTPVVYFSQSANRG